MTDSGDFNATKLPVWRTVGDAYATISDNIEDLFAVATGPAAFCVLIWYLGVEAFGAPLGAEDGQLRAGHWLVILCQLVIASSFVIAWLRFVLLGKRGSELPFEFRIGRREGRYLLYLVILSAPFIVVNFIGIGVVTAFVMASDDPSMFMSAVLLIALISIAALVAGAVVHVRCQFVFPAIAVDLKYGPRTAWSATRGVGWRMFAVMLISFLPYWLLISLLMWSYRTLDAGGDELTWTALLGSVQQVVGFAGAAVTLAAVAHAFRQVTGWRAVVEGE